MIEIKDWVAVYAALLSTLTATVQIINARRDRPRLRVKVSTEIATGRDASKNLKHTIVRLANIGTRPLMIYRPTLELAQHTSSVSRIFYASPSDEYDDGRYDWAEIEPGPDEPLNSKKPVRSYTDSPFQALPKY